MKFQGTQAKGHYVTSTRGLLLGVSQVMIVTSDASHTDQALEGLSGDYVGHEFQDGGSLKIIMKATTTQAPQKTVTDSSQSTALKAEPLLTFQTLDYFLHPQLRLLVSWKASVANGCQKGFYISFCL